MSESSKLPETIYKLIVRFSNGEKFNYITSEQIASHHINSETQYALISSFALNDPAECTDVTLINLRDVAFIKTEKITLDDLAAGKRTAGLHSQSASLNDDKLPKTMSQVKFF
jgi:hypothetical protein